MRGERTLTSFSELPRHLEATEEAEMLKKVVLHSVATARASRVLPVPGGPYSRMPCTFQGNAVTQCRRCIVLALYRLIQQQNQSSAGLFSNKQCGQHQEGHI